LLIYCNILNYSVYADKVLNIINGEQKYFYLLLARCSKVHVAITYQVLNISSSNYQVV